MPSLGIVSCTPLEYIGSCKSIFLGFITDVFDVVSSAARKKSVPIDNES